jgi:hypothetical protein
MSTWRRSLPEDIKRGTVVRGPGADRNPFSDAVILRVDGDVVYLARPMAYAHTHFDSNSPLLTAEVYSVFASSILESFEVLPYSTGGTATTYTT